MFVVPENKLIFLFRRFKAITTHYPSNEIFLELGTYTFSSIVKIIRNKNLTSAQC